MFEIITPWKTFWRTHQTECFSLSFISHIDNTNVGYKSANVGNEGDISYLTILSKMLNCIISLILLESDTFNVQWYCRRRGLMYIDNKLITFMAISSKGHYWICSVLPLLWLHWTLQRQSSIFAWHRRSYL